LGKAYTYLRMFLRTLVMSLTVVGGLGAVMCNGNIPLSGLTCALGVSTPLLPIDGTTFAMMAAAANQFEIQSSQIALIKSQNPGVLSFAQTLINDHSLLASSLSAAAISAGLAAPVAVLTADQQQMINNLQVASFNFDQLFLQDQIMAHEMALALQSNYASFGTASALSVAASNAVPIIQSHLTTATTLLAANSGMLASAFCPTSYWCNSDFDILGTSFSVCCPSNVPLLPPASISATVYTPVAGAASGSLVCVGGMCAVYGTAPLG